MQLNTIRYDEFQYEVSKESQLSASINLAGLDSRLIWALDVWAADTSAYAHQEGPRHLHADAFFHLRGVCRCQDLVGRSVEEELPEESDICVYTGVHESAISYRVEILDRRGSEFLIHANWNVYVPVEAFAWVPLTGVLVYVDEAVFGDRVRSFDLPNPDADEIPWSPMRDTLYADMIAHASDAVQKRLVIEEFGEPEVRQFFLVWFPFLGRTEAKPQ